MPRIVEPDCDFVDARARQPGRMDVEATVHNVIKLPVAAMSLRVARGVYNPESERIHFYVSFKPTLDPTSEERGSEAEYKVDVAVSVTETGELADLAFTLPEFCRDRRCLDYISRTHSASVIDNRVFVTVPGLSGDSVLEADGILELDGAGKIMGVEIS